MAAQMKNVDILMVGKTGNGKSALGNAILQKKAFKSMSSVESVTQDITVDYSEFENTVIKIVDGPGVGDTNEDKVKAASLVVDAMTRAVMTSAEGFHAILIVVRYGGRFTEEDITAIKTLRDIFGDTFINKHSILVMTCGDNFKTDAEENGITFEDWCQKQGGYFSKLLKEVNNRVLLFDNRAKGEEGLEQIRSLLSTIASLCSNGARYTSNIFLEAKLTRDRLVVESKRPLLQEKTIREAGLITQKLGCADYTNPEKELDRLNVLKIRADNLLQSVLEQDKGTKALSTAIDVANSLVKTIDEQTEKAKRFIRLKKREEDLNRKIKEDKERRIRAEKQRAEELKERARKREEEEKKRVKEEEKREEEERKREEEEKKKEEERKREEEEKIRKEEEEKKRIEEEKKKEEETLKECERRERELQEIKAAEEKREAERLEEERRTKEKQEAEEREAQRQEAEKKRQEQERIEAEKRRQEQQKIEEERLKHEAEMQLEKDKLEEEWKKLEEERERELEEIKQERAILEQEKQNDLKKQEEIDKLYKGMKEEENKTLFSKATELGAKVFGWFKKKILGK